MKRKQIQDILKQVHDILKQIYQHVQHEYDRQPLDTKTINESLIELRKFKLTEPTSKQGKELYAQVKKSLEQYIALPKDGKLDSIEEGLLLLQLLKEFQVQDQQLAKEEHQKKENELHAEIQEATHRKFQQIAAEVAAMIQQRIKAEIEYQEFLERQRKEKEEEERKRLLAIALAAFRELFEELENSTATSKIFLDGREVDVEHKAIFMLDDYKNLHEKYFTNEISEDNYLSERIGIVLQYLQRHHSSKATHDHAVAVDRNMTGEMKQKKSYGNAAKARENLASLKTEKLETRTVRQEKDEKTEAEVQAAKNVSGEKVEAETEEAEKIQAKKNVDVGKSSLVENIETASTGKRDEWSDLLGELGAESTELTSAPPRETPSVVDKMINTGKAAVALEKKPEETKNKAENKKDPGEENNETSPTPRPRR